VAAFSSPPPRRKRGNLVHNELVAGTTLYLPIYVDGALVSVGDGHGVQGDGEVCVTAIETGLIGTFELHLREDMHPIEQPLAQKLLFLDAHQRLGRRRYEQDRATAAVVDDDIGHVAGEQAIAICPGKGEPEARTREPPHRDRARSRRTHIAREGAHWNAHGLGSRTAPSSQARTA